MSATFVAGAKLRAFQAVPQRIWTVTSTASTTATSAEAVFATSPSTTYQNGGAWQLTFQGRMSSVSAATATAGGIAVRDTNLAGAIRVSVGWFQTTATINTNPIAVNWRMLITNTSGADVVGRVLVATLTSSSAVTLQIQASSALPYGWSCDYIGLATDYAEGITF